MEFELSSRLYPRMTLRLRAPLEVENLLPYDIKFRIHDKHSGLSSRNWLNRGLSSPIHTVEVSHLMLISISAEDTSVLFPFVSVQELTIRPQSERLRHHWK
jgi:vacuolar protein sorting-associated protein 13A/C